MATGQPKRLAGKSAPPCMRRRFQALQHRSMAAVLSSKILSFEGSGGRGRPDCCVQVARAL
eukprot:CAMPEP_0204578860 /NCGR_PEP_ID=MMETSP0661-20131031/43173_1 /ASSEMBLY_ACC=CAM_ASM_000606 /TAXON_ID=109239 /ORGANISM="Alexandrium margalefi, Strain AMGDE01CS-322" /LENGTH=60 /DNA_ID=CAMNT_0051587825 /DNA_START=109 /DNA_END=288 /DNA_ORIENTATION=-